MFKRLVHRYLTVIRAWTWPVSFGMLLCFFSGLSFVLDPIQHTIPRTSPFFIATGGRPWIIGIFFLLLSVLSFLWPVRGGLLTVTLVYLTGLALGVRPFNAVAIILYVLLICFSWKTTRDRYKLSMWIVQLRDQHDEIAAERGFGIPKGASDQRKNP